MGNFPLKHGTYKKEIIDQIKEVRGEFFSILKTEVEMGKYFKCNVCGQSVSYSDIMSGKAIHRLIYPSSEFSDETYETLCPKHNEYNITYEKLADVLGDTFIHSNMDSNEEQWRIICKKLEDGGYKIIKDNKNE